MSIRASIWCLVALSQLSITATSAAGAGLEAHVTGLHNAENANGKLDKNVMGVPKEGYGASRGARGAFGPKYDDARFDYRGGSLTMPIALRY